MRAGGLTRRRLAVAAVGAVLVLAGCQYAGGGTVRSATGSGKAVFGFNMECPAGSNTQSGKLAYTDLGAGVAIKATGSGPAAEGGCQSNSQGAGAFSGTYRATNGPDGTGRFLLIVNPARSGHAKGAAFSLQLTGGPFDGYSNSGPVLQGSIQPVGGPNA